MLGGHGGSCGGGQGGDGGIDGRTSDLIAEFIKEDVNTTDELFPENFGQFRRFFQNANGRTHKWMDRPSYRNARTHLKTLTLVGKTLTLVGKNPNSS